MEVDHIIVGAGIAGISLALELDSMGRSVVVADAGEPVTSSKVAAGMVNPIVPKRICKAWMCDEIFEQIEPFYKKWETLLGKKYYETKELLQVHSTAQEANNWAAKYDTLADYILMGNDALPACVNAPFGYSVIRHGGRLDVAQFCQDGLNYLAAKYPVLNCNFNYQTLIKSGEYWNYETIKTRSVIFCEGIRAMDNPWFSYLPFIPTAGDILELAIPELTNETRVLKQKHWLLGIGGDRFLSGGNFHHQSLDNTPNKTDADAIVRDLQKWLSCNIQLVQQKRAVRPTVRHRRPLLGEHAKEKGLFIFNGLGTKGSSLCSWLAPMLAKHICFGEPLHDEVDIRNLG